MNNITLINREIDGSVVEAYRTLRTNILFSNSETKVITVTSSDEGDGKSTVSFNMALGLAQINKRVLYIDADMRKSRFVQKHVGAADVKGLSHFLSAQANVDEIVYETDVEGLFVIMAGVFPPNPAELLLGKVFPDFISEARESFDYVIIDAPPIGLVSDATICAANSDGVIFVINSERTSFKDAKNAKKALEDTGARILGCVLNGIKRRGRNYYGKYNKYTY